MMTNMFATNMGWKLIGKVIMPPERLIYFLFTLGIHFGQLLKSHLSDNKYRLVLIMKNIKILMEALLHV